MTDSPNANVEPISKLASISLGYSPKPEERMPMGKYLLIGGRNINNGHLVTSDKDTYINDIPKNSFHRAIAKPGDIIVSTLFDRRKLCIYRSTDPRAVVNSSCAIIRAPFNNDYIVSYLRTSQGREQFLRDATKATGGTVIPKLSIRNLSMIQVPLIPLEELQRLGDDHIQSSTTDELIILRNELQSKDAQIALLNQLVENYNNERLKKIDDQILINNLIKRIKKGETSKLEFKSSLRWNLKSNQKDTAIESAVLKTIVAFCNTDGGELLIGVVDDGTIFGIEKDNLNDDKFLLHLRNLIHGRIIPSIVQYVDFEIVYISGIRICRVICKQSKEGVWLKADKNDREVFYVRSGPSSSELLPHDAVRYIFEHFHNQ